MSDLAAEVGDAVARIGVVGPDDVLVIELPESVDYEAIRSIQSTLEARIGDRFLILAGGVRTSIVSKADCDGYARDKEGGR